MRFPVFSFTVAVFLVTLAEQAFAAGAAPVQSQDASGTIAVTSTYQLVKSFDPNRSGCTIQNNGTHNMIVRTAGVSAWNVPAGWQFSCVNGPISVSDKIEITGTAGDAFTAAFQ